MRGFLQRGGFNRFLERSGFPRRGSRDWLRTVRRRRQRPVAQRFQTCAGDVENFFAAGATVAQRFEVVLQAGHRIGERIELAATGHALAFDQLGLDVLADRLQITRRLWDFQHAQRAADFFQQARHFGQALVVPVGFDEGHERLARSGEIGDGLVREHFHHAPGFHRAGIVFATGIGAQVLDLVVQRCVHVQQRTGDIQQQVVVDDAGAGHHVAQRIALLADDAARHAQPHHPEGVGDCAQLAHLHLQVGGVATGAHVQIQRILDAHQFFFDRASNGVEQLTVATAQAAACVFHFVRGGIAGIRVERQQHGFVDAFHTACGADFIEQRQQHDRNVAVAVLQALQVIGQQHAATHQRGAGFITIGHLTGADRIGQLLQLLGHHRRGIQLDHAQGALHLVQVAGAEAHPAAIGRVFHVVLDLVAHLAQGLVQLRLDPAQGRVAHGIAQRAHARTPGRWARVSCCCVWRCIIC
ncbi:hypothetical protein D3C71_1191890 [compost metagenome]